jgi:ATP-dependent RNA helicase RhlE
MQSHAFTQFGLSTQILDAVRAQGYTVPTEIQFQSIPCLLEGQDLLGTAQTGTGKTAAFVLPVLERLLQGPLQQNAPEKSPNEQSKNTQRGRSAKNRRYSGPARPRALILAPTRELAIQIDDSITNYSTGTGIRHTVVYGGAPKPTQATKLRSNPDILTATPGRLMDFIGEGIIDISDVRIFLLDEADRMLDMGFIPEVRRIAGMAANREQTILFSATMPAEIEILARELLKNPQRIAIEPRKVTVDGIQQTVLHMAREDKTSVLPQLIRDKSMYRVLVFTRTKHRATRIAKLLSRENIPSDAIHGDRTQSQRQRALESFKRGRIQALVATDVASRGIDVDDVTHVINFEIPGEPESYVHRIGRTGRAGNLGTAIAFCDREELKDFRQIEKHLGAPITIDRDHPYHQEPVAARPANRYGSQPKTRSNKKYRPFGNTRKNGR